MVKELFADLHIHSRFSRACSKDLNIPNLVKWARVKGLGLLGTGDFTHPEWFKEVSEMEEGDGVLWYKDEGGEFPFIWQSEISLIYTQGRGRKVHLIILAPCRDAVEKINSWLDTKGRRDYDGRPIFKISCRDFVAKMEEIDDRIEVIPAHCLLPDSLIQVKEGVKEIKEISKGDYVLTHFGRFKKVNELFKRKYNGEIIRLIPSCLKIGSWFTSEHPIYAIKSYKSCKNMPHTICKPSCAYLKKNCKLKAYEKYKSEWKQIKDLEKGDIILYPRYKKVKDTSCLDLSRIFQDFFIDEDYVKPRREKVFVKNIPINKKIIISEDFCRLIGYYLAEGYVTYKHIGFTFNKNEVDYLKDLENLLIKVFGPFLNIKLVEEDSGGVSLIVHSKILVKFFKMFYSFDIFRAYTKKLPSWFLDLPTNKLKQLLIGWWRGDKGVTTSVNLMNQFKTILIKMGIIPSIDKVTSKRVNELRKNKSNKIGDRIISANKDYYSFKLSFFNDYRELLELPEFKRFKTKLNRRRGWIDKDYIYLPIIRIDKKDYKGFVYNLEVDKDNSYLTENLAVHNCWTPYFGVFGSMSGFDSLKEAFLDKVDRVHAIETGLSCYDRETEVLTKNGWKKFYNIKNSDEICTLNIDSNIIEYQKPTKVYRYRYKGKMYKLKTKRVDLLVTPNHQLLVGHCDFRKPVTFSLKRADQSFNKSKRFKKDGIWLGESPEYFVLPEVKMKHGSKYYSGFRNKREKKFLMEDWLKFFGFWIAEGWTTEGKDGDYNVCICNNDKELLLEFKEILESFGYTPYIRGNLLRIRDYQLFSYLRKFGKSMEKFIPYEIKSLSKELLGILFDYYIKGDGHRYGRSMKGLSATTISKQLRNDLQEIALKIGMSAYYKLHNKKGTPIYSLSMAKLRGYKQSADSWVIYFIRKNIYTVLPSTIKKWNYNESWIDFDDDVFCVSVPNKVIYVRRNGIPVWCGNSDPEMNWKINELNGRSIVSFSDSHSFWPWRLGRECTIFRVGDEGLSYDLILRQIRENSFLGTIEVDPAYGKYHFDGHSNCKFSCSPEESKRLRGICPKCGRSLVIGVDNRVDKLKNQEIDAVEGKKKYYTMLPLHEIISLAIGIGMNSKKVWGIYDKMIEKFGNEFRVLLEVSKEELEGVVDSELVELILKNRRGEIKVKPGYDGEYGVALLDVDKRGGRVVGKDIQKRLF